MFNGEQNPTTETMRETCKEEFTKRYPKDRDRKLKQNTYNEYVSAMCEADNLWRNSRYGHKLEYVSTALRNYNESKKKNATGTEPNLLLDQINTFMNDIDRENYEEKMSGNRSMASWEGGSRRRRSRRTGGLRRRSRRK